MGVLVGLLLGAGIRDFPFGLNPGMRVGLFYAELYFLVMPETCDSETPSTL